MSSLDSSDGVFYNNASVGRYADPRSCKQVHFRVGLAAVHIIGRDDSLKTLRSRQRFKDYVDVPGRGAAEVDCLKPSLLLKPVYPTFNPG